MSSIIRSRNFFVSAVLAVCAVLGARDAAACPNATRPEVDQDVRDVARAEKDIQNDDFVKARKDLKAARRWAAEISHSTSGAYRIFGGHTREGDKNPNLALIPVLLRAERLFALVAVRDPSSTQAEKTLAREIMLDFVQNTSDPTMAIDAAEVFSHSDDLAPLALMMLRSYAEKDLIGSAWAYAALARMERAQGNTAAEASALERCRRMAKHETTCTAAP